jgi:preprotein translocase subunit SecF
LDIVAKRGWYFLFSALIILPGLVSMIVPPGWASLESGLRPGIDFSSGSAMHVTFESRVAEEQVQERMDQLGHAEALIQKIGDRSFLIRTKLLEEAVAGGLSERAAIQDDLDKSVAPIEAASFDSVSPIIAGETVRNAIYSVLAASVFILLYIWYAFRRVPKSYRYGFSAILALAHDVVVVLGVFSILGKAMNMEVNSMFIVGVLIVAGYSVNDTIVVFDRIRENVTRYPDRGLASLVNLSIMDTVARSLNTSFTTLFVLLALLLLGGPSIRGLLLVVAIGTVVGTYSSIFIASQFLVIWERGEIGRLFGRGRRAASTAAATMMGLIGR